MLSKQGYQRNIELSQNIKAKHINESGNNQKSNKFTRKLDKGFESTVWLKKYHKFLWRRKRCFNKIINEIQIYVIYLSIIIL